MNDCIQYYEGDYPADIKELQKDSNWPFVGCSHANNNAVFTEMIEKPIHPSIPIP